MIDRHRPRRCCCCRTASTPTTRCCCTTTSSSSSCTKCCKGRKGGQPDHCQGSSLGVIRSWRDARRSRRGRRCLRAAGTTGHAWSSRCGQLPRCSPTCATCTGARVDSNGSASLAGTRSSPSAAGAGAAASRWCAVGSRDPGIGGAWSVATIIIAIMTVEIVIIAVLIVVIVVGRAAITSSSATHR